MIRLLCVEDDPLMRAYLATRLDAEPDMQVVSAVPDTSRALVYLSRADVDVVLLDFHLHGHDGMRLLQAMSPWQSGLDVDTQQPAVLFCTGFAGVDLAARARLLGARGVVSKDRLSTDLILAVRTVAGGGCWFPDQTVTVV